MPLYFGDGSEPAQQLDEAVEQLHNDLLDECTDMKVRKVSRQGEPHVVVNSICWVLLVGAHRWAVAAAAQRLEGLRHMLRSSCLLPSLVKLDVLHCRCRRCTRRQAATPRWVGGSPQGWEKAAAGKGWNALRLQQQLALC